MDKNDISRRKFVSTGAIVLGGVAAFGFPAIGRAGVQSDTIRVGMIGTGSRGTGVAATLKDVKGIELVACCDIIPEHLANGLKQAAPGAKAYTDYKKLLDDKSLDAVIIAVPLFLHYPVAVDALDSGKHVYLEKSMALNITQTLDLVKRVKAKSDQVFQIGFQYRYYGLYEKVKEAIDKGWVGKVTDVVCQYNQNSNWRQPNNDPKMERLINWRMYREYCGGPLSELCAHEIDAMHRVFNARPVKVTGIGSINYWKDGRDTYDNIQTIYEYNNGMTMKVGSVLSNAYNSYSIRILGDKGTIDIQRTKAMLYPESASRRRATVDGVTGATVAAIPTTAQELTFEKTLEPTIYCLEAFVDCIRNKKIPVSNAMVSKDTSIAIHMGNAAADTGVTQFWKPEYDLV